MHSQKNVLQVLVSAFNAESNSLTVDALPDGELGFFDKNGDIAASGAGRFVVRKGTKFIESSYVDNFAGWAGVQSYAAPTYHRETLTLTGAVVAGTYYSMRVEMDIKGMTGKYIKQGVYKAVTGDTTTNVATGLVASLNAALTREGNTALTVTSNLGVITITQNAQTYVPMKKLGWAVPFTSQINNGPDVDIQLGTVTVPGSHGVGTGAYVKEQELFAWGNQDPYRYNSWRNNFDPLGYADETAEYDVLKVNETQSVESANADVKVNLSILIAFDSNGNAPAV